MKTDNTKRATIYLNSALHHALRLKAAETEHTISELVNEAVSFALAEDSTDLSEYNKRKKEPTITFESFLKKLKKDGKI
ncbi:MAG: CopG family transcriptional regulator [Candidatus Omnitrophica bacterium]|nr:CopG family transcriptional regulator [Candidatus Omnitrophota bacterium]